MEINQEKFKEFQMFQQFLAMQDQSKTKSGGSGVVPYDGSHVHGGPKAKPFTNLTYLWGPECNHDKPIISTLCASDCTINQVPIQRTRKDSTIVNFLVGAEDTSDHEATCDCSSCSFGPVAGQQFGGCSQIVCNGCFKYSTGEINIRDLRRGKRCVNESVSFANQPMFYNIQGEFFRRFGVPTSNVLQDSIGNQIYNAWAAVANSLYKAMATQFWTGTGTNGQIRGLESLIKEGHVDAVTGVECPSLDSILCDLDCCCINDGRDPKANKRIVEEVHNMARKLIRRAKKWNFGEVDWCIVMPEEMYNKLHKLWDIEVTTILMQSAKSQRNITATVNPADFVAQINAMRLDPHLMIDGRRWNVLFDECMPTTMCDGQPAADIYFIPKSFNSGRDLSLYFDTMDNTELDDIIDEIGMTSYFSSDGGYWNWSMNETNGCVIWGAELQTRLVLCTPQLAGRLMNICYADDSCCGEWEDLTNTREGNFDEPTPCGLQCDDPNCEGCPDPETEVQQVILPQ